MVQGSSPWRGTMVRRHQHVNKRETLRVPELEIDNGCVAQLEERRVVCADVAGSSPVMAAKRQAGDKPGRLEQRRRGLSRYSSDSGTRASLRELQSLDGEVAHGPLAQLG